MKLDIAFVFTLMFLSLAFAAAEIPSQYPQALAQLSPVSGSQPDACNLTIHVGDTISAQGYSAKLGSITTDENGTATASITAYYGGFQVWGGQISGNPTGTKSFTNPLDGTTISITGCEVMAGDNGYARVAVTGLNFTLIPANPSQPAAAQPPAAEPLAAEPTPDLYNSGSTGNSAVAASLLISTPGASSAQAISLPLGQAVAAGSYSLKLVGAPSSGTASIQVSDSQGALIGTYDVNAGSAYDVPVASGASPLTLSLQTVSGAQGASAGAQGSAASEENAQPPEAATAAGAPTAAPSTGAAASQQSSNIQQLIAVLVIVIGMIIASFVALYQLSRNTGVVQDSTMKLFENETRAGIMKQLAEADRIPTDLANSLDKSKAAVVEHLDILMGEGLVERIETPGKKFVFYRLTQKGKQALLKMAG